MTNPIVILSSLISIILLITTFFPSKIFKTNKKLTGIGWGLLGVLFLSNVSILFISIYQNNSYEDKISKFTSSIEKQKENVYKNLKIEVLHNLRILSEFDTSFLETNKYSKRTAILEMKSIYIKRYSEFAGLEEHFQGFQTTCSLIDIFNTINTVTKNSTGKEKEYNIEQWKKVHAQLRINLTHLCRIIYTYNYNEFDLYDFNTTLNYNLDSLLQTYPIRVFGSND